MIVVHNINKVLPKHRIMCREREREREREACTGSLYCLVKLLDVLFKHTQHKALYCLHTVEVRVYTLQLKRESYTHVGV